MWLCVIVRHTASTYTYNNNTYGVGKLYYHALLYGKNTTLRDKSVLRTTGDQVVKNTYRGNSKYYINVCKENYDVTYEKKRVFFIHTLNVFFSVDL